MIRTTNFNSALYALIGIRIRELRTDCDLNQEELATKVGVSRTSIANIEAGRHQPPLHVLYKIFEALNSDIYTNLPSQSELEGYLNTEETEFMSILDNTNLDEATKDGVKDYILNLS